MKINKIKINSYGKLKEKEIKLKDGINIIYGKNESGKSTLLNFIVNSFYGISKNKKGKEYSDVEKYTPWLGEEFSGKLEYELNNKNKYEIYRDFKKKNPKIFNENMEDISKEFNIDKSKGNEFFYEQTKVDEELFLSTVVVGQQEVKLGKQEQNILVQKIANLVGTGDDNVSYKRAIDRINRRLLDEIGTQRSREKPINIINKKIEDLEQKKQELEKYEDIKYEIEENKNKLEEEISDLNNKNNLLKEIKIINEKEKIEKEKIKIKENIKKENIEKIKLIKEKINKIKNENKNIFEINNEKTKNNKKINNEKNKLNKKIIIVFIFLLIINFLQFIFIKNKLINYIFLLTVPMTLIYFIISKNKLNKKIKKQKNIDENNLKNIEKINLEINNLNNEINLLEKNNNNLENINYEIEKLQNEINNKKIRSHTLELDQKNIEPKLDNLSKIEEELVNNNERMSTLNKLNLSFELAKEILAESYEEMRNTVTPKFTQELSKNISEITEKKYSKIMFNDEQGLIVELESGNYVPASKLSIGTIDQLYLSLRLSMIDELSEENLPIILDEAFAYYDTERLTNILKYLDEKYKTHQIILFTCTNREKEILEKIKVPYNLIEL